MNTAQRPSSSGGAALSVLLNAGGLAGICLSLLIAFYYQLALGEIPCPLCMLQRIGLMMVGFGFFMNLRFGPRASHYSIIIVSALVGATASLRQVLLHITPGSGFYGSSILGYHMYTLGFITFVACIFAAAVLMVLDRDQLSSRAALTFSPWRKALGALLLSLCVANLASNVLVCGFAMCSGDPTGYVLLQ